MYDYLSKSISSPIFQAIANINRDDLFLYVKNQADAFKSDD